MEDNLIMPHVIVVGRGLIVHLNPIGESRVSPIAFLQDHSIKFDKFI